ncbi:hypothetical protein KY319_03375 [Candidatus Woesearchaeota archaeon]|nr:hypothetical protein [Candidatus Woesearchaeota archaeon]
MAPLKTATGTDEIGDVVVAVVMVDSDERSKIERDLKQYGFNVRCFSDEKGYANAARQIQFGAVLAQGATSTEVGRALKLAAQPGKYCLVNSNRAIIDMLSLQSLIGYCLEPEYSREDLVKTVEQMLRES